jgi:tetratricopeptide (TPR) repeat protein
MRARRSARQFAVRDQSAGIPAVQKLLSEAVREHRAGRLEKAKLLYLQILGIDARHDKSLFGLGLVAHQLGGLDVAEKMIRRAIAINGKEAVYHSSLGLTLQALKRQSEAFTEFQYVLMLNPNDEEAHFNLATLLLELGKLKEARTSFERAITHRPDYAEAHNNLGNVHLRIGSLEEARKCYTRALDLRPDWATVHNNLGKVLQEQGRLDEAKKHYEQSLALKCDCPDVMTNLGNVYRYQRKFEDAKRCFDLALSLNPNYPQAHNSRGIVFQQLGNYEEAKICHERALALNPDSADALNNLGVALCELRAHTDSVACLERAIAIRPEWAEAHNNLGFAFRAQGKFHQATACYQRALSLRPAYAEALSNMGIVLQNQCKLEEAMRYYEQAVDSDPSYFKAKWNKALLELLLGDFEKGWKGYEVRHHIREVAPRSFSSPLWLGGPLNGARILLHAEQGLGDTIQFLRYVPRVQAAGGTVLLHVPGTLFRLTESMPGIVEVATECESLPEFDCHCPLMSLPLAFGTKLISIPGTVPYLNVPNEARKAADAIPWGTGTFHVGLAWSGNPAHREDQFRSILLSQFEPLFSLSGLQFFSLQIGSAASQLGTFQNPVIDLQLAIEDMADTAALISHLDLVITVDTAVAHLAAALGKPTWVLLPFAPDWRWLLDRDDSPWYPTMRLFRQPRIGDWNSVIEQVLNKLTSIVGCGNKTS